MPQPIDMQSELARTTMMERIQDAAGRANLAALQRASEDNEQARVDAESQVVESREAEGREVEGDGRRKNPFLRRRRAKEAASSEQDAPHRADIEPHRFDRSI